MLSTLFFITITAWLIIIFISWLIPSVFGDKTFPIVRSAHITLALLMIFVGSLGFLDHQTIIQPIPWLFFGFHPSLRMDPLSSFFVLLMGGCYFGVSSFSFDYLKHFDRLQQKKIQAWTGLFVFAMLLVFTANDPFMFLLAWEFMTLSSYFLVVSIEPNKSTRKAGFLYLGIAHISLFAIAVGFFLFSAHSSLNAMQFNNWIIVQQTQPYANVIFFLIFFGFGAKAGLFPLHVWLPEAHPAAPSPVSALMSAVMLKTAIYGLLRFTFYFLLPYQHIWWGYGLVFFGLITMLIGVIHAAMQKDMKRLLAYSSMENMGFIVVAVGLAIIFYQYQLFTLSNLALTVVLLHSLNHSLFKSLLFLGTGSILHATGERNLGKLGGLIHKMPWVAVCTLIGTLAMAGLPLFNGFISEWLYLALFFHHGFFTHFSLALLSPLIVAISVLVFGLAGFVIVKFFGIAFLGQPRESILMQAQPTALFERIGLGWLAFACILLGIWPNGIIDAIQTLNSNLIPSLAMAIQSQSLFTINFASDPTNGYGFNPLLLGVSLGLLLIIVFLCLKRFSPLLPRRTPIWDCGFRWLTARMQDTAEGFGQPFKQIFSRIIEIKLRLPSAADSNPYYQSQVTEKIWRFFYFPIVVFVTQVASLTKWVQQGKISTYLLYIAITLLILLTWVVWS